MKICSNCKIEKDENEFSKNKSSKKDGLDSWCKICKSEYNKKYKKEHRAEISDYNKNYHKNNYEERKEHIIETVKNYRNNNIEKAKESKRKSYEKHREKNLKKFKEYREKNENKIKRNIHEKERIEKDIGYKLRKNLRTSIHKTLKRAKKIDSITRNLGCSTEFLIQYLESKFQPHMTWENYGSEWHIDHIIPLSAFDLQNIIHFRAAGNYKNLQPLWKEQNKSKFNKYNKEDLDNYLKLFEDNNNEI